LSAAATLWFEKRGVGRRVRHFQKTVAPSTLILVNSLLVKEG
jgi:hypothetical protein